MATVKTGRTAVEGGPDFLGIGMERAGTSWLFTMLAAHPEIWVPPIKELHYFDVISPELKGRRRRYNRHLLGRVKQKSAHFWRFTHRPEFYKNGPLEYMRWDSRFFIGPQDDNWYRSLFDQSFTRGRVSGEITPAYCNLSSEMIARIHRINPAMKFVLMVRDPADRAWSGMIFKLCRIDGRRFDTIEEDEMLQHLSSTYVTAHSNLGSILETWSHAVPAERLFIRPTSALASDAGGLLADLYGFLGVSRDFLPAADLMGRQINTHTQQSYEKPPAVVKYLEETYGVRSRLPTPGH